MTTVGNGDLVPDNGFTKLLSSIFAFIGMGLVGLVMGKTGEFLAARQERILVKAIYICIIKLVQMNLRKSLRPT